jgi:hypothetical protein
MDPARPSMIDLHTHTDASDGRCSPAELVRRAVRAGITTLAITDHDTVAGVPDAASDAARAGLTLVPGIEITSVVEGADVHVLGYFVDVESRALAEFLAAQRADRVRRLRAMGGRLAALGCPLDIEALVASRRRSGHSVGRPLVADALIEAGYVDSVAEAFDRFLGEGRPAYEPRCGATPVEVIGRIVDAGGVASLAHPGTLNRDDLIPALVGAGLAAIEVYHSDHLPEQVERYRHLAAEHGLAATGGSDYHADGEYGADLGGVLLPAGDYADLVGRARRSGRAAPRTVEGSGRAVPGLDA